MKGKDSDSAALAQDWQSNSRWKGIHRDYSPEDVLRLRPSIEMKYSIAEHGANRLWQSMKEEPFIRSLGASTGAQAVQMARAGLKSIYCSGWQVAADANLSGQTYPDQSLYPSNSVPAHVRRINNALMRADLIERSETGQSTCDWYLPIVADAEAGFGASVHAFELMKSMIEAGAAAVHFEDQLAAEKKCGHLGGKVLVPTSQFIKTLIAARLAADICNVPTILIARTDAVGATLLTSDIDPRDKEFCTAERTEEGFFKVKCGIDFAIARSLAYAQYADVLWFETSTPDIEEARKFADSVHKEHPGKLLAYNCSPSFNWKKNLDDKTIASFNQRLGEMGYKYQFITLAGWHSVNLNAFKLSQAYEQMGMTAYVNLQEEEFNLEKSGYTAVRHQREVGTGYFDDVLTVINGGLASTSAVSGSTESEQFETPAKTKATKNQQAEAKKSSAST
ncbi:MAG TPA: isocitrate lyase [Oculatellaceae cyanobacterium]